AAAERGRSDRDRIRPDRRADLARLRGGVPVARPQPDQYLHHHQRHPFRRNRLIFPAQEEESLKNNFPTVSRWRHGRRFPRRSLPCRKNRKPPSPPSPPSRASRTATT